MNYNNVVAIDGEFDHLIGEELFLGTESPENYRGKIVEIETVVGGYGHESSFLVTDEIDRNTGIGYRFKCEKLRDSKPAFGEITTTKMKVPHSHRRDRKCIACATGNAISVCWNCGCQGPAKVAEFGEICEGCHGETGVVR